MLHLWSHIHFLSLPPMPVSVLSLVTTPSPPPASPHLSPAHPSAYRKLILFSIYFGLRIRKLSQTQASPYCPDPRLLGEFFLHVWPYHPYEEWEEKLPKSQALCPEYPLTTKEISNLLSQLNP
uniref:Uncharacterized protein n=1 Tax=Myotis myotis TaxID=51298 RepID=A0A7J7VZC8_MYOMY|nr:hypothetical protein mMyoMyo1_012341 [Myotis myotis]